MKIWFLILLLLPLKGFADSSAHCDLVTGFYQNSSASLTDLKFETVADIFTINNAHTISLKLNGEDLRFIRTDISVRKQTKLIYVLRKNFQAIRAAHVMLDRTPKDATATKEFYGNIIISPETRNERDLENLMSRPNSLVYNFYCRI